LSERLGLGPFSIWLLKCNEVTLRIRNHEPTCTPMRSLRAHDHVRCCGNFSEPCLKVLDTEVKGRSLPIDAMGPRMVFARMSLGQHDLNRTTIENEAPGPSLTAPSRHRVPPQAVSIKGNGAIEIARSDEQVTEAILRHVRKTEP